MDNNQKTPQDKKVAVKKSVPEPIEVTVEQLLSAALQLAKQEEAVTRNTVLTRSIASVLNIHFRGSREEVKTILKSISTTNVPVDTSNKKWEVYQGKAPAPKKNLKKRENAVTEKTKKEDKPEIDTEEILGRLSEMTPQEILDTFGNIDKVKNWCKEVGIDDLDHTAEPQEFLENLIIAMGGEISPKE